MTGGLRLGEDVNTRYNLRFIVAWFMDDYVVVVDLVMYTGYLSYRIASLICVGPTGRARMNVFSKDSIPLLLSLLCTNSYSCRHVRDRNNDKLK